MLIASLKVEMVRGEPHLILVAAQDIGVGEELTYNYGITYKKLICRILLIVNLKSKHLKGRLEGMCQCASRFSKKSIKAFLRQTFFEPGKHCEDPRL